MSWLKHLITVGLLLAAAGVVLATALSDHSDDYGQVPLPQGGTVHLPEGKTTVYFSVLGNDTDPIRQVGGIVLHVVPVGGGEPLTMTSTDGTTSDIAVSRSETIGELGAIAKLDVPSTGDYLVSGGSDLPAGAAFLKFGTNAGTALLQRWKLLVGLVVGAMLIALIPTPRSRRRWEDPAGEPTGWSSDPRAPYAG